MGAVATDKVSAHPSGTAVTLFQLTAVTQLEVLGASDFLEEVKRDASVRYFNWKVLDNSI